ncbi:AAA family ATPase [Gordonia sp. OPL2]|uniref:AAA family ATPase n=1 Tax=Gordonia sp. OPL2 TaxID=2486274 RepID=UPI001654EA9F|nr:AAA family ATPase [Gordonia sp. OPL2]ROZ88074.1 hypothetical protein EEB19_22300 [Gordonia sp. OPL2]
MHLARFRVRKYRNIVDSGIINVESGVTCLVGMNEAGKTAVLSALHRLKPVDGATFSTQHDYPRWLLTKDRKAGLIADTRPIEAVFTLSKDEMTQVADHFGEGVLTKSELTIYRLYDDATTWWSTASNESKAVAALLDRIDPAPPVNAELLDARSFEDLRARLTALAERSADDPAVTATIATVSEAITALVGTDTVSKAIIHFLGDRVPKFFYFGEYSVLEGRIDLHLLSQTATEQTASSSDQTARALLTLADTTPEALSSEDYEDRRAELEAVSNDLTAQVFEYWKQNPSLRVRFDLDRAASNVTQGQPQTAGNVLDVRVEDTRHYFTNNFSQRSSGFRWFFSFLAAFTEFEARTDTFVILLDEPGLTLHGRAQADFLRFINERLAPAGQVIYTTHSPFMVETGRIERVRIVEDKGPKDGAVVSQEVLSVDADSLFPLQAALGYDIAQHLFIGDSNLLVEGPSDFVFLDLMSRRLADEGRTALEQHWRILPAGSASNIPAFVALVGRGLEVTVVVDSGTEGAERLSTAMEAGRLSSERLIRIGEIIDARHADIEDLFTVADYLSLYNKAFNRRVRETDLPPGDRIVYRLQKLRDKFDHYKPAEVLLRDPKRVYALSERTLTNFEALITRINASRK